MYQLFDDLVKFYQYKFLVSYTAINSICYFILLIVGLKIKFGRVNVPNGHFITKSIIFVTVVNVIDTFWKWIDEGPFIVTKESATLMNTAYFIAMHYLYLFLFYYFYTAAINKPLSNKRLLIMSMPTQLMVVLNIVNMKFPIMYYIADDCSYVRTNLYMLEYVIPYLYLFIPYLKACQIIHKARKEKLPFKKVNRDILTIPMTIGVFGTIGMFYTTIPLLSVALALTMLFMYIDLLDDFVTVDPISALPNKMEFINELKHRIDIENVKHRNDLYIIIIDILRLRDINEHYGYSEGDMVIRRISNILRRKSITGDKLNLYACRYSGDKYLLVVNSDTSEYIMNFCTNLQLKITNSDNINQTKYKVEVMYGFAKYENSISASKLIEEAEKNLNINKIKFESLKSNFEKKYNTSMMSNQKET